MVPLESSSVSKARRTQLWFSQSGIRGILGGDVEGEERRGEEEEKEEERAVIAFKTKGGHVWERDAKQEMEVKGEQE